MNTSDRMGQPTAGPVDLVGSSAGPTAVALQAGNAILAQADGALCGSCGSLPVAVETAVPDEAGDSVEPYYVYAVGQIEARFPSLGLEKEFRQVAGPPVANRPPPLADPQVVESVLSQNRYLVRQLCWVLTIEGQSAYILRPRDPRGYEMLLDAVRALAAIPRTITDPLERRNAVLNVVVGVGGPLAPPELCNGAELPIVVFDQIFSVTRDELVRMSREVQDRLGQMRLRLPRQAAAEGVPVPVDRIQAAVQYLLQAKDNAGRTDEHRALNFVAVRDAEVYALVTRMAGLEADYSLSAVEVSESRLSEATGGRRILAVKITFASQLGGFARYFTRVDVTGEFPFVVTPLQAFYDRT